MMYVGTQQTSSMQDFQHTNTWIDFAARNKIEYWKFVRCDRIIQNEASCTPGKWNQTGKSMQIEELLNESFETYTYTTSQ